MASVLNLMRRNKMELIITILSIAISMIVGVLFGISYTLREILAVLKKEK